jgi:UDP-glucose 4-epimerase
MLHAKIQYVPEREGDIKHIKQDARQAKAKLGFESTVELQDRIWDSFPQVAHAA